MSFYVDRYLNRKRLSFQVEIVTPVFLGGAQQKNAELRGASIKGLLRFWWRALYGVNNPIEMCERENEIFGSTDTKSLISIVIKSDKLKSLNGTNIPNGTMFTPKGKHFKVSIVKYLGFGLYDFADGWKRDYFPPDGKFNISITFNTSEQGIIDQVENSFKALVCFGGLGAKTRNGFGSLHLPGLRGGFKDGVTRFIDDNSGSQTKINSTGLKPFTAISNKSKLFKYNHYYKWVDALSEIGMKYKDARLSIEPRHKFKKRPLIAKPLIIKKERVNIPDRHAKPYFLHVNKLGEQKYQGQILFLPYDYYQSAQKTAYQDACTKLNKHL